MAIIVAFPILGILLALQSAVFSRIHLLHGAADLVLLALIAWSLQEQAHAIWHWAIIGGIMVSLISALPLGTPLIGYLIVVTLAYKMRKGIWQIPVLAMFVATFLGTFISQGISLIALRLIENPMPIIPAINLIILPSTILNLLLAFPFFAVMGDLANLISPAKLKV